MTASNGGMERNPEGTWERYLSVIDECARLQERQERALYYLEAALQGYPNDGDILAARDWLAQGDRK